MSRRFIKHFRNKCVTNCACYSLSTAICTCSIYRNNIFCMPCRRYFCFRNNLITLGAFYNSFTCNSTGCGDCFSYLCVLMSFRLTQAVSRRTLYNNHFILFCLLSGNRKRNIIIRNNYFYRINYLFGYLINRTFLSNIYFTCFNLNFYCLFFHEHRVSVFTCKINIDKVVIGYFFQHNRH